MPTAPTTLPGRAAAVPGRPRALLLVAAGLLAALPAHALPARGLQRPRSMTLQESLLWGLQRKKAPVSRAPGSPERLQLQRQAARRLLLKPMPAGAWSEIAWAGVQRLALERLDHPQRIAQGSETLLCGPAVALNATALLNPLRYARLVREVYGQGTFNGLAISGKLRRQPPVLEPRPRGRSARPRRSQANPLDWMMLSSLRNAYGRHGFLGRTGFRPLSVNLPFEVRGWLSEVAGLQQVSTQGSFLRTLLRPLPEKIRAINDAVGGGGERAVVLLLDMKGLRPAGPHSLHWVRLAAPIQTTADGQVKLTLFDHGRHRDYQIPGKLFSRRLLHVIVGAPATP